jgi:hypothetical protein
MSNISPTTGSIPFHIAKAYGAQSPQRTGGAQQTQQAGAIKSSEGLEGVGGPSAKLPTAAQKLVGARVPGKVDFSGDAPVQSAGGGGGAGNLAASALPLYRHPADKNAAATAVSIGRSLDVTG